MTTLLDGKTREEMEIMLGMCNEALASNDKLDALKHELELYVGRVLSRSDAVKYANEVRVLIQQRLEVGLAENDNRRQ